MTIEACREYESLLVRAADGSLDAADRSRLDAHLATCNACRAALDDQRAGHEALASRPIVRAQPDFAMRVAAAIEADRSWLDRLDFRIWTWRLAPVAAALALVAWTVVRSSATAIATSPASATGTAVSAFAGDLPVATALWDSSVSDTALLSLMMRANADDRLADTYKER
jgi:anti-sigma factor RsiW